MKLEELHLVLMELYHIIQSDVWLLSLAQVATTTTPAGSACGTAYVTALQNAQKAGVSKLLSYVVQLYEKPLSLRCMI